MLALVGIIFLIVYYAWSMIFGSKIMPEPIVNPLTIFHIAAPKKISIEPITVSAISAVAFDQASGARIFDQNGDTKRPIASLTKLMTALVFLDHNPSWDKEIIIQKDDLQSGGHANLFAGDIISLKDLFTAALIASDNTGTTALRRATGLSQEDFVKAMNEKAKELRLHSASFVDPTGLEVGNSATAVDVSKLAASAFAEPDIYQALQLDHYRFRVSKSVWREVFSTNQLLGEPLANQAKIIAGKTGHLDEAGFCFAGEFLSNGHKIITVVLGAPTEEERFSETKKILDWTLSSYLWDNIK